MLHSSERIPQNSPVHPPPTPDDPEGWWTYATVADNEQLREAVEHLTRFQHQHLFFDGQLHFNRQRDHTRVQQTLPILLSYPWLGFAFGSIVMFLFILQWFSIFVLSPSVWLIVFGLYVISACICLIAALWLQSHWYDSVHAAAQKLYWNYWICLIRYERLRLQAYKTGQRPAPFDDLDKRLNDTLKKFQDVFASLLDYPSDFGADFLLRQRSWFELILLCNGLMWFVHRRVCSDLASYKSLLDTSGKLLDDGEDIQAGIVTIHVSMKEELNELLTELQRLGTQLKHEGQLTFEGLVPIGKKLKKARNQLKAARAFCDEYNQDQRSWQSLVCAYEYLPEAERLMRDSANELGKIADLRQKYNDALKKVDERLAELNSAIAVDKNEQLSINVVIFEEFTRRVGNHVEAWRSLPGSPSTYQRVDMIVPELLNKIAERKNQLEQKRNMLNRVCEHERMYLQVKAQLDKEKDITPNGLDDLIDQCRKAHTFIKNALALLRVKPTSEWMMEVTELQLRAEVGVPAEEITKQLAEVKDWREKRDKIWSKLQKALDDLDQDTRSHPDGLPAVSVDEFEARHSKLTDILNAQRQKPGDVRSYKVVIDLDIEMIKLIGKMRQRLEFKRTQLVEVLRCKDTLTEQQQKRKEAGAHTPDGWRKVDEYLQRVADVLATMELLLCEPTDKQWDTLITPKTLNDVVETVLKEVESDIAAVVQARKTFDEILVKAVEWLSEFQQAIDRNSSDDFQVDVGEFRATHEQLATELAQHKREATSQTAYERIGPLIEKRKPLIENARKSLEQKRKLLQDVQALKRNLNTLERNIADERTLTDNGLDEEIGDRLPVLGFLNRAELMLITSSGAMWNTELSDTELDRQVIKPLEDVRKKLVNVSHMRLTSEQQCEMVDQKLQSFKHSVSRNVRVEQHVNSDEFVNTVTKGTKIIDAILQQSHSPQNYRKALQQLDSLNKDIESQTERLQQKRRLMELVSQYQDQAKELVRQLRDMHPQAREIIKLVTIMDTVGKLLDGYGVNLSTNSSPDWEEKVSEQRLTEEIVGQITVVQKGIQQIIQYQKNAQMALDEMERELSQLGITLRQFRGLDISFNYEDGLTEFENWKMRKQHIEELLSSREVTCELCDKSAREMKQFINDIRKMYTLLEKRCNLVVKIDRDIKALHKATYSMQKELYHQGETHGIIFQSLHSDLEAVRRNSKNKYDQIVKLQNNTQIEEIRKRIFEDSTKKINSIRIRRDHFIEIKRVINTYQGFDVNIHVLLEYLESTESPRRVIHEDHSLRPLIHKLREIYQMLVILAHKDTEEDKQMETNQNKLKELEVDMWDTLKQMLKVVRQRHNDLQGTVMHWQCLKNTHDQMKNMLDKATKADTTAGLDKLYSFAQAFKDICKYDSMLYEDSNKLKENENSVLDLLNALPRYVVAEDLKMNQEFANSRILEARKAETSQIALNSLQRAKNYLEQRGVKPSTVITHYNTNAQTIETVTQGSHANTKIHHNISHESANTSEAKPLPLKADDRT